MLEYIDIKGKTVTADAMHCQKETCRKIKEKGGDYVLGLKKNQKMLYEDVKLYMKENINEKEMEIYTAVNKNTITYSTTSAEIVPNPAMWKMH